MANEAHYFILMQYIGICPSNFARALKEAKRRGIPSLASVVQVSDFQADHPLEGIL